MAQINSCTRRALPGIMAATAVIGMAVMAYEVMARVEVSGASMAPALLPGDRLLVLRWPRLVARWPAPGEVIAVRDPRQPARVLVKRVGSVDRLRGTVEVLGDQASASTDSRVFGPVPRSLVVGRAIYRYAPSGRVGSGPWHPSYDRSDGEPAGRFGSDPAGPSPATKGKA